MTVYIQVDNNRALAAYCKAEGLLAEGWHELMRAAEAIDASEEAEYQAGKAKIDDAMERYYFATSFRNITMTHAVHGLKREQQRIQRGKLLAGMANAPYNVTEGEAYYLASIESGGWLTDFDYRRADLLVKAQLLPKA